jgi:leader peptidase (prepilin peptidase)/N-methyltransferase
MFLFGAIIGSFLNVCIYRIPAGQSIVSPPSRCPQCDTSIRWYQNIPIISYLLLRGRCAGCGKKISHRYPLVEALTGLLFVGVWLVFGWQAATPLYWVFAAALVVITFIDLRNKRVRPARLQLPQSMLR